MIALLRIVPLWGWLALALAASIGGNLLQARAAIIEEATAPLERELTDLRHARQLESAMAEAAAAQHDQLLEDLDAIAARGARVEVRYVDRVRQLPAPACAPGAQRVEAWNTYAEEGTNEPAAEAPGQRPGGG